MDRVFFHPSATFIGKAGKVFACEEHRIGALLPFADVQHVGSTAIPGSVTKGDLDIVVRVPREAFQAASDALRALYEVNQIENWSDSFASFKKETASAIDVGAQLVVMDSTSDDFHTLRDMLRSDPVLLEQYNAMKLRHQGKRMDAYRREKAAFFQTLRDTLGRNERSRRWR